MKKRPFTAERCRCLGAAAPSLALALTLLASPGAAEADLLIYEPFDYPAETAIAGTTANGLNLTGPYAATLVVPGSMALRIESPGLDYGTLTGAPAAAGNRLSQDQGVTAAAVRVNVDDEVATAPGTAIFWSALFTLDDSANGNHLANITGNDDDTGDTLFFGESAVGVRGARVAATTGATGGLVAASADNAFTNAQTLLLIGRYVNAAAPEGDGLELIGYDTADAVTLPASFDPADPNAQFSLALAGIDIDFAKITSLDFTIRAAGNNFIDELRIGSTYAAVIPEPATASLMLGSAAAGAVALSRRRRPRSRPTLF